VPRNSRGVAAQSRQKPAEKEAPIMAREGVLADDGMKPQELPVGAKSMVVLTRSTTWGSRSRESSRSCQSDRQQRRSRFLPSVCVSSMETMHLVAAI